MDTQRIPRLLCGGSSTKGMIILSALLVLQPWAQAAYADSVPTFTAQTNIDISNDGEIDARSTFQGPGINLNGLGNAICEWGPCGVPLTPGSSLNPTLSAIDFGPDGPSGTLTLGGQQVVCGDAECSLLATEINTAGSITFPTNGQNFTVTVPAQLPELTGSVFGSTGVQPFNIRGSSGELVLFFNFTDFPSPSYQFEGAVFSTPEPGTLGLMMVGLAGILVMGSAGFRRMLNCRSRTQGNAVGRGSSGVEQGITLSILLLAGSSVASPQETLDATSGSMQFMNDAGPSR